MSRARKQAVSAFLQVLLTSAAGFSLPCWQFLRSSVFISGQSFFLILP
jgi:hypothetical protein